jgi:hypothetical protein
MNLGEVYVDRYKSSTRVETGAYVMVDVAE